MRDIGSQGQIVSTFTDSVLPVPSLPPPLASKDRIAPLSSSGSSSSPPTSHSGFHSSHSRSSSKQNEFFLPQTELSDPSDLPTPQLEKDQIEFAVVDYFTESCFLEPNRLRDQLVIQFPDLISRPQPTHKIKPNAPPPALIPRPTLISEEEKNARKESLSICVERQEERSIIKALVVLESRKVSFRKVGKAAEDALAEDLPVMPSPWLIYLDVSSLLMEGKRKNKKTYELSEFKCNAKCGSCTGSRLIPCAGCSSIEADECFWCDGTGKRKGGKLDGQICSVCQGRNFYCCGLCNNSGKVECQECNLQGVVEKSAFVEVSLRSVELPAIPLAALFDRLPGDSLPTAYEVRSVAINRVLSLIEKACSSIDTDVVPLMARCLWERSTVSTIEVIKPLLKWKGKDGLENSTSFTETKTHYFNISSSPNSKPQEVYSRPGSSINREKLLRSDTAAGAPRPASLPSQSIEKESNCSGNEIRFPSPKIRKQKSLSQILRGFKSRSRPTSISNSASSESSSSPNTSPEFRVHNLSVQAVDIGRARTWAPFHNADDPASKSQPQFSSMLGLSNVFMEPQSSVIYSGIEAVSSMNS